MSDIAEDELYEVVNLPPRLTGLPMTVWARSHGNAQHDVSIKVNMTPGRTMDPTNLACNGPSTAIGTIVGSTRNDSHYALGTSPPRRRQRSVILSEPLRA